MNKRIKTSALDSAAIRISNLARGLAARAAIEIVPRTRRATATWSAIANLIPARRISRIATGK
jgi:hypothetical protein